MAADGQASVHAQNRVAILLGRGMVDPRRLRQGSRSRALSSSLLRRAKDKLIAERSRSAALVFEHTSVERTRPRSIEAVQMSMDMSMGIACGSDRRSFDDGSRKGEARQPALKAMLRVSSVPPIMFNPYLDYFT